MPSQAISAAEQLLQNAMAAKLSQSVQKRDKKIYMMRGLPASGKTTTALEMVRKSNGLIVRVSNDDLAMMFVGEKFSDRHTGLIRLALESVIEKALHLDYDVVVDNVNLKLRHQGQLQAIADRVSATLIIVDMDTPLEECIRRDSLRTDPIGEDVIRKMATE